MTVTLYQGDCLEILPTLGLENIAVITDPPYGIDYNPQRYNNTTTDSAFTMIDGDDAEFDPRPLLQYKSIILWGANNYTRYLPRGGWLCWDKRCSEKADRMFGSPFELAWINNASKFKIARIQHGGVVNADGYGIARVHPTQKPIRLMEWCLSFIPSDYTVIDPFMGSGTTGVACVRNGRNFIGIEISEEYFKIAQQRISEAQFQPSLNMPSSPEPDEPEWKQVKIGLAKWLKEQE